MNRMGKNDDSRPGTAPGQNRDDRSTSSTSPVLGNGQPIIAGTISAINGNSLTVTTASNITYIVDTTNAKILAGQNAITLSNVVIGNKVLVQGTVNGTSVTASTVMDQSVANNGHDQGPGKPSSGNQKPKGFLGGIGHFFMHLFGF
jgi:hypothetical protein